jgi:predicted dehydrogenase
VTILDIDWKVKLGKKTDYGIAHVGCGGIVQYAHIPAYRKSGFRTVAAYDINRANAEKVAAETGAKLYENLDDLLADPAVEIVDIAVPPQEQIGIVEKAAAAKKHMLCQKPLAVDFNDALHIVALAKEAGVKQALQQQMRWDAGIAASKLMILQGMIGQPTDAQIQVSCETPWHMWPWLASSPILEVMFHSIHYIDSLRFLFGEPEWVTSRHTRYPLQGNVKGESKTVTVFDYADGLQILIAANHYNLHGETYAVFRFIGTEGAIEGTIGTMYNYPYGRPDTLVYRQRGKDDVDLPLDEMWIPDAFAGPMASLMEAIETDGVPITDSADNLNTLRIIHAEYLSMAENRSVRPTEIQGS